MQIRFKKLNELAKMPTKAHPTDAGFDLTATSRESDINGNLVFGTGIAVEIPDGYVGLIFPRSSICKQQLMMCNSVGVIDSGYRGEMMVKFKKGESASFLSPNYEPLYNIGDRVAQIIIIPYPSIEFVEVDNLTDSDRGKGGHGSSGR
jgi:dUTP pyrophosphatase